MREFHENTIYKSGSSSFEFANFRDQAKFEFASFAKNLVEKKNTRTAGEYKFSPVQMQRFFTEVFFPHFVTFLLVVVNRRAESHNRYVA
mgnify:CR=1 FL=1